MGRALIVLLTLTVIIMPAQKADASPKNVQELLELCKAKQSSVAASYCLGYISGVVDMMQSIALGGPPASTQIGACGDISQFTGGALVQLFVNWAERFPKSWTFHPLVVVTASIREQLPCNPN
jgi:hypothetical protein